MQSALHQHDGNHGGYERNVPGCHSEHHGSGDGRGAWMGSCECSDEPEGTPRNYGNGYTKKTIKTQLGEWTSRSPGLERLFRAQDHRQVWLERRRNGG